MDAGALLYVGDDICCRIPVLERSGIVVLRSRCSVRGVRRSFAKAQRISAVAFHNDVAPPADEVVLTARELSKAPLILFKNPRIEYDDWLFDVVLSVPSPNLRPAFERAHNLFRRSKELREECAALGEATRTLQEISMRNRIPRFDYDALFRPQHEKDDDDGRS